MRRAFGVVLLAAVGVLGACGPAVHVDPMPYDQDDPRAGTPQEARADRGEVAAAPVAAARPVAPRGPGARTGTIARASLTAVLDAGPGAFLRGFEIAPVMDGQRFAGWRLVQLMSGEHRFDGLDVVPGDVLLAVNGQPVSRPDQLSALWDSLRAANELVVELRRGEGSVQLRFAINPPAGAAAAAATAPKP